jgi:uncharacterized protein YehS (DUF1456 family)
MTNNDILIRIRYALNITDLKLVDLFALAGRPMTAEDIRPLFFKEGEEGYRECDGATLGAFLEGLVTSRRGKKEGAEAGKPVDRKEGTPAEKPIDRKEGATAEKLAARPAWSGSPSNNDVLKAVRIALELRDDDVAAILRLAGVEASKAEIGALFRKKGQENFRPCGDQFLRNFLAGLTKKYRV